MAASEVGALILAGGAGTRLRPMVSDVPKPMAAVGDRPFMEYLLLQLGRDGFSDVIVCAGFMADHLQAYFGDGSHWGMTIRYSIETEPRGTAGAIKLAEALLRDDRWLIMNGDSFFDISLRDLVAQHEQSPALISMALAPAGDPGRYGGVSLTPEGVISEFVEKSAGSTVRWINAGIYVAERAVLDLIPAGRSVSLERDVLPSLAGIHLRGFAQDGYFVDIGVPADYLRVRDEPGPLRSLIGEVR